MLTRIDISYPHQMVVGGQFPPSPSTVFQAIVAANGHRLDAIKDVLEALETGKCVRIVQHSKTSPIKIRSSLPRMPKPSEVVNFKFGNPEDKLLEPQSVFPLDDGDDGVHLSYYFEMPPVPHDRLIDVLRLNVLGRGESVCMSCVSVQDKLNDTEAGIVWAPGYGQKQQKLDVPYSDFLTNIRLYYGAKKSNRKVPRQSTMFAIKNSITPYSAIRYRLYDQNGDAFSYPQELMSDISAMMRHAVMAALQGKVDAEYVSGHTDVHPFYLPVPTIGHEHADGDIRRIIVAEPASGPQLLSKKQTAITSLNLVNDGKFVCRAMQETDNDGVLALYLGTSKKFHTVTPMILDRDGGQQRVGKRIEALIVKAGFPKPTRVTFNKTWWGGKLPVPVARCAVHVEVEFPVAVSGPLSAGVAEGYGIGLFANREGF